MIPTHAAAFQVLDAQGDVLVNDWFHGPLLRTLEAVEERFHARVIEQEFQVGLIRVPLPSYAPTTFREALNNAFQHRDFTRQGAVHVQWFPDYLFISSPGGFLEGLTLNNLLVHEPKPRNTLLSDAFRRIGLVETTGRGIDKIYLGQLRYGRALPDYSRSDREAVRLTIPGGKPNVGFAVLVAERDRDGTALGLDDLLALHCLITEQVATAERVGASTQKGETHARSVLARLADHGLVETRSEVGGTYRISTALARRLGFHSTKRPRSGTDRQRLEELVLQHVASHGRITRSEAAELGAIGLDEASRLLRSLVTEGKLRLAGTKRWSRYELP